jgi:hypothetical protein
MEQGSKIFLSRLPVDVAEKEVEVSLRNHACGFSNCCLNTVVPGAVQENGWAFEGVVPYIQFTR